MLLLGFDTKKTIYQFRLDNFRFEFKEDCYLFIKLIMPFLNPLAIVFSDVHEPENVRLEDKILANSSLRKYHEESVGICTDKLLVEHLALTLIGNDLAAAPKILLLKK